MELELKLPVASQNSEASQQRPAAVKARLLKISKRTPLEQVFRAIVRNCLAQIQANEAGVAQEYEGYDEESLHQMRVGLRRLHSAFGLFKDVLQPPEHLQQELDWLATPLGAARDWDVLAGSTLPAVAAALQEDISLAELTLAAQGRAQEKHVVASAAIRSPRYAKLVRYIRSLLRRGGWRVPLPRQGQERAPERIAKFARNTLTHDQRSLRKRGKKLHGADAEARHRVRIAAKKTRYALEFFQSLYAAKRVKPYLAALSDLQDELGALNDAAVADRLLKKLEERQPDLAASAHVVREYLAGRVGASERKCRKQWKIFAAMKAPC